MLPRSNAPARTAAAAVPPPPAQQVLFASPSPVHDVVTDSLERPADLNAVHHCPALDEAASHGRGLQVTRRSWNGHGSGTAGGHVTLAGLGLAGATAVEHGCEAYVYIPQSQTPAPPPPPPHCARITSSSRPDHDALVSPAPSRRLRMRTAGVAPATTSRAELPAPHPSGHRKWRPPATTKRGRRSRVVHTAIRLLLVPARHMSTAQAADQRRVPTASPRRSCHLRERQHQT